MAVIIYIIDLLFYLSLNTLFHHFASTH